MINFYLLENWGAFPSPEDWDNEEYTGSLADTKVFTPSGGTESTVNKEAEVLKPNENAYLEVEDWNDAVQAPNQQAAAANVIIQKYLFKNKLLLIFFFKKILEIGF